MPGSVEVEKLSDYMRVAEAADYVGVSPNTLRNWVNAGKIAAVRHPVNDYRLFKKEGERIVFWNDPEKEFQNTLPFINLDGVTTLRLNEVGALEAKIRLEREEPNSKFLLYAPTEEPDYEDDWLLDIRLYSRSFRADKASILLQELRLVNLHLRTHVSDRRKFFDAKNRLQKIKNLVAPDDRRC